MIIFIDFCKGFNIIGRSKMVDILRAYRILEKFVEAIAIMCDNSQGSITWR